MGLKPILVLTIVLILSILTIFNVHPRYRYFSFFDKIMSYDLGYSAPSDFNGKSYELLLKILINSPSILLSNIKGYPDRPVLDRIDLDLKFLDYQKILQDKKEAISREILVSPSDVKGRIRYKGKNYKANIRLKGDLAQHWRSKYRMSLRISLKGKNTLLGYKKFSVHKPSARQHPYDQVFQSLIRRAGNLAPDHTYAKIFMNGASWGIMNIEEHMSKEMLEKQKRKEALILRFGNEERWAYRMGSNNPYADYRLSDVVLNQNVYGGKKYLQQELYRKWMSYIAKQRLLQDDSSLYDIDSYSRALFLSIIWNSTHTLAPGNSRQYFNPYTLKLEPITTDQGAFNDLSVEKRYSLTSDIYKQIVITEKYKNYLYKNFNVIADVISHIDEDLNYYQSYFPLDNVVDSSVVKENLKLIRSNLDFYLLPQEDDSNKSYDSTVIDMLPDESQADEFPVHIYARHFDNGVIDLYNLLPEKVKVSNLLLDNQAIDFKPIEISGYEPNAYTPISVDTEFKGIFDGRLSVETEYKGNLRVYHITPTHLTEGISNPILNETRTSYPFLKNEGNNNWLIKEGEWHLDEPLLIDGSLTIAAGAHIYFSENAYIIIKGGSLRAMGEVNNKIKFKPKERSWKGLYVLDSRNPSVLEHVVIKGASETEHDLLKLTSGVTFYKSDVVLSNVEILGSQAEDALNIVSSKFTIKNTTINESKSDGFDSDFSSGEILNSNFSNIKGDAVDFSGSQVQINNVKIENVHDKGVSVGESSEVYVSNSFIKNVGVGIASKDGSQTMATNVTINSYQLHAAMTYIKKDIFDSPILKLVNCTVEGKANDYISQNGTFMTVDNKEIASEKIDVKSLYQKSVMKK